MSLVAGSWLDLDSESDIDHDGLVNNISSTATRMLCPKCTLCALKGLTNAMGEIFRDESLIMRYATP
jgi:hypothetical protein